MTRLVPVGYQTFHEAVTDIECAMFAGVPDRAVIAKLRQSGDDLADGETRQQAIIELWNGVDKDKLQAVAIGGQPRRTIKVSAVQTKAIPALRKSGDFSYLRPRNSLYSQFAAYFGLDFANVTLAFEKREIEKWCGTLRRTRRRATSSDGAKNSKGRQSRQSEVAPIIQDLIATKRWSAAQSLKSLTQQVNRKLKRLVSEDTITRALDQLFEKTSDRRFQRNRRKRP